MLDATSEAVAIPARPPRPAPPRIADIPYELQIRPQWVVWAHTLKSDGKYAKVPYQPANPKREAKANDPATWSSFDLAWEVYQSGALDGIGYEFAVDDPYFGVALSRRSRMALISCSVPQAHDDAKTITPDWVSTRILDVWLQYSAKFFAEQAKLELKQPNASEQEFFMKLADVRPMLDAAKRSGREVTSETADRLSAWVLDKGLAGLTEGDARCRKLIH